MKQLLRMGVLAAMAVCMVGCLEMKLQFGVKNDGSGTIKVESFMGGMMLMNMETKAAGDKEKLKAQIYDEAKMKAAAANFGEGVTFVKGEYVERKDGSKGAVAVYKFDDITKVTMSMNAMSAGGASPKKDGGKFNFQFDKASKKLTLVSGEKGKLVKKDDKPAPTDAQVQQSMQMMQMMKGLKVQMSVLPLDKVAKTNASHVDAESSEVTLMELDMDKILADKESLQKFAKQKFETFKQFNEAKIPGIKAQDPEVDIVIEFK